MKSMTRRYLIVFALAAVQVAGMVVLFSSYLLFYHRGQVQSEIRHADDAALQYIDFTAEKFNAIQWTEEGREFEFDGVWYDVARIEKTDSGYRVVVQRDLFEVLLTQFMKSDLNGAQGLALQLTFAPPESPMDWQPLSAIIFTQHHPESISLYRSCSHECQTPPPRG